MVMPERLPTPLPAAPEVPASTASAARIVAAPKVASAEFTAVSKRRSFTAQYKLQMLAETDRAVYPQPAAKCQVALNLGSGTDQ